MRIGTTSYRNIQNGPQTLRGVRETAIVKPIGEGMKLKRTWINIVNSDVMDVT